ncbi:hypothetical protein COCON_G00017020 [Conger conger]|uniref:Gap junction delta-2 protein n=1 Tax=Conger conger TaxID=82655 RepID=A0A9Q1E3S5_CONCO|nr:hypothetical protein COCON_G00017020 [Conger conger]
MGEWTILERLLEAAVQQHSTMIGRILLTVVVIFRILIVAIVGETVYDDEQTMFVCNTLQPGSQLDAASIGELAFFPVPPSCALKRVQSITGGGERRPHSVKVTENLQSTPPTQKKAGLGAAHPTLLWGRARRSVCQDDSATCKKIK